MPEIVIDSQSKKCYKKQLRLMIEYKKPRLVRGKVLQA